MATDVRWVGYGREAAAALRAAVAAAKAAEPLAPVTVVVPGNHVGVAARRLLASGVLGPVCERGRGLAAVTFVTTYRLAELLGAAGLAGTARRPVSTPVIAAALRAALADEPGVFAPIASHPATETALVAAYRELRDVSPAARARLAAGGRRAADVVRLADAARAALAPSWYDEQDLAAAAAARLEADPRAARELGAVVVHLPQLLSRHAARLLGAVAARAPVTVLAGATGEPGADGEVVTSLRRMGVDAPPPPSAPPLTRVVAADRTRVVTASDADDEARSAVRAVVDAARHGTPLDRVAVLHAAAEPYGRLVHERLAAAGIPANGAAVVPLTARVAGRTLLRLLSLGGDGVRRHDLFAWLAGAPVLHEGRWAPVAGWERVSRAAGVVAGRADWDARLATHAAQLEAEAAAVEADPDQPAWRAVRARADADLARSLRAFAVALADDLAAAAARPRPWEEHARWARRRLAALLGDATRRDSWPRVERDAAERVDRALDRLAALGTVEGPVGLDVFARTLELELDADLGRVGRLGEGVLVGGIGMGVGLDLDLVVVLGLSEGTFPGPVRDDALLPDDERRRALGELPLRQDALDRQHRQLLATLAGATRHVLGVPRGDLRRSTERLPSRWVLDVAGELAGGRWWPQDLLTRHAPWLDHVASFDDGLRRATFPATAQEHRLKRLVADVGDGRLTADLAADPVLAAGATAMAARRSARFTRFDGNLAGLPVPSPVDAVTSPTRLEHWASCPFAYLLEHLLRVEPVDNPEEQLQATAIDKGNLVHEALARFLDEVLARPADAQPRPGQAWSAADRARLRVIAEQLCDELEAHGRAGRPVFWRRDRARLLADLDRFLDEDEVQRATRRARPLATELGFGLPGAALGAAPLAMPDGRHVRFRGRADRLDRDEDGGLHVLDYKTGKADPYRGLGPDDPAQAGRRLQLAVYGAAARLHDAATPGAPVRAEYWFVSSRGGFDHIGYDVTPEVLADVGRTLATVVAGIEGGVFAPHPAESSTGPFVTCRYCDPDGLGVADLRRQWERKRHDPALALFADLAEPLAEPELALDGAGGGAEEGAAGG